MNDNSTNATRDMSQADSTASEGTPTAPLQGFAPNYAPPEARYTPPNQPPPPPVPPAPPINPYPPQDYPTQDSSQQWKGRYRRRAGSTVAPVILIGAGLVFLMNNLGVLPWSIWDQVWRLWPLILIAIGLELVIGRRNPAIALVIVVVLVVAALAFLTAGYNGGFGNFQPLGNLATSNLNAPLSGATSASVELALGTCNLTVDSTANAESLAMGTLEYYQGRTAPEQNLTRQNNHATLTVRQHDSGGFDFGSWFGEKRTPEWNIHLNPSVPTTFKANLGTGNSEIDLSQSQINTVNIDSGTGNAGVVFPSSAGQVTGTVNGGVGNLNLTIPDGLEARIDVSTGIGNINMDDRFTKQDNVYVTKGYNDAKNKLDLKLDVGVGNVRVGR